MKNLAKIKITQHITSSQFKCFLLIFLSWSLSVAQPIMNMLGKQPVFLIAHEIRGWSLVSSTLVLSFIPPFLLWLFVAVTGVISPALKEWLARITISILMAIFFLPFVQSFPYYYAVFSALIFAILIIIALIKIEIVKSFALWFAPTSLIFILQFLFFSDAKQLRPYQFEPENTESAKHKNPVYIFVLDELPLISILNDNQEIDGSRFPAIAQFAKESTWYPNTVAISSATDIALPAILSGQKPEKQNKIGSYEQYPENLFSYFALTHSIHSVENTTRMCPPHICKPIIKDKYKVLIEDVVVTFSYTFFSNDKLYKLPPINDRWIGYMREINSEKTKKHGFSERKTTFNQFIDTFEEYPNDSLHFLHILLPHAPWRILPNLKLYGFYENDGTPGEKSDHDPTSKYKHQWTNDIWATQLSWRKHLLQVGAVDSLLKKAINRIKQLGQFDDAVIIVTADHGAAFIPNLSRRFAHDVNIPDIGAIPLFIKYPNQKTGEIDSRNASNIDILPTLLDVFSIKSNKSITGFSLQGKNIRSHPASIFQEGGITTKIPENYQTLFKKHLNEKNKLFPGEGWSGVYHTNDSHEFYDKNISSLTIQNTLNNAIKFSNANLFQKIIPKGNYLPVYYRLKVQRKIENLTEILLGLNGKIVSHCYMYKHAPNECSGLIDPKIFTKAKPGNNLHFRIFQVVNKQEGYTVVELLTNEKLFATIKSKQGVEGIKIQTREFKPINVNGNTYGTVTIRLTNNSSTYEVSGWAGDTMTGKVAKTIYLFIDNKLFTTTGLSMPKKYLERVFGFTSLINSGYQITIPLEQLPEFFDRKLRVFAENNYGEISELNYILEEKNKELYSVFNMQTNRKVPKNKKALLKRKAKNLSISLQNSTTLFDAFDQKYRDLLIGDWYKIKNKRQWIGASISFAIANTDSFNSIFFEISARPLLHDESIEKQSVEIFINEKLQKTISFNKTDKISFNLNLQKEHENPLIVTLKMPNAASPTSLGTGKDNRKLSLYLSQFKITRKINQ